MNKFRFLCRLTVLFAFLLTAGREIAFADSGLRIGNLIISSGSNVSVLPGYQMTSVCGDDRTSMEEQPAASPTENPSVCLSPAACSDDVQQACREQCGENKECLSACMRENSSGNPENDTAGGSSENSHGCGTPEECQDKITKECSIQCSGEEECFIKCMNDRRDEWNPNPGHYAIDTEQPTVDSGVLLPSDDFLTDISELVKYDLLGRDTHRVTYYVYPEDITESLAKLRDWFAEAIGEAKNIIVHYDLSWANGNPNPQWDAAACGFIGRFGSGNMLFLELNHQGEAEIRSRSGGANFTYHSGRYDTAGANGSASVTIALADSDASILYDHKIAAYSKEIALTDPGYWGFYVNSGTDSGFGTRCVFANIEVLAFDNE